MKCVDCKWYQDGICYNCEGFDKPLYGVGIGKRIANKETDCPAFEPSKKKDARDLISFSPEVIPEQKTARWVEIDDDDFGVWKCSECGVYFCLIAGTPKDNAYHYCPHCGIKMN